jgi:alpha-tubulin suppressor-like RCC1 family protein
VTIGGTSRCWNELWLDVMTSYNVLRAPAFVSLAAGDDHKCGLTSSGLAYCWGYNVVGQVGDGTLDNPVPIPSPVYGGRRFTSITAGFIHTCALDLGGTAYCWGQNFFGALGDGTVTDRHVPTRVATTLRFVKISGGNSHTCALTKEGEAYCWGNGYAGQLGNGVLGQTVAPSAVLGGLRFRDIAAGGVHTCGVTRNDVVYCWGYNFDGEIGDGTMTNRLLPTLVLR